MVGKLQLWLYLTQSEDNLLTQSTFKFLQAFLKGERIILIRP